jgi:hypothetical protein
MTSEIRRGHGSTAPNKTEPRPPSRVSEEDGTSYARRIRDCACDVCEEDREMTRGSVRVQRPEHGEERGT